MCVLAEQPQAEYGAEISATPAALSLADAKLMVEQMAKSEAWQKLDAIDEELEAHPEAFFELPTEHLFPPGQYVRTVLMNAGRFITTRIHLVEHPFIVSAGSALVWTAEHGVIEISAPYIGLTPPGVRRLLYILDDCVWTTIHPNPDNETDPKKIVARVTYNNRELREKARISP